MAHPFPTKLDERLSRSEIVEIVGQGYDAKVMLCEVVLCQTRIQLAPEIPRGVRQCSEPGLKKVGLTESGAGPL